MGAHKAKKAVLYTAVSFVLTGAVCYGALKAGAARVDITPEAGVWLSGYGHRKKPSEAVADELYARALVLDDGETKIAMVSTDLLWVPLEITRAIRKEVTEKIGIAGDNVLVCGTHTHFGPKVDRPAAEWPDAADSEISSSYIERLKDGVVESICEADKKAIAALVGATEGRIAEIVYNRRTVRPDGSVVNTFRLPAREENLTFGVVDEAVSILRVEDERGGLIGAVVNYACHPVSGATDPNTFYHISADYPGVTAGVIEQVEGGTCLFALGTAGDMNPRRRGRKQPRAEIGKALAGEVLRRLQTVETTDEIRLRALRKSVVFPLKAQDGDEGEAKEGKAKESLTTEIQLLRIGDIYVLGLPGEVLVEIGLEIKEKAGVEKLFVVSIANDAIGYVCTEEAYRQGGYESTSATRLAVGAGELMVAEALKLIEAIR